MKKKILITFFMLISLIFVLSASVSAITLEESIDIYEGYFDGKTVESIDSIVASEHINPSIYAKYEDTAINARAELNCSCGEKHVYPTYYITKFYEADASWGHNNSTLYGNTVFHVSFEDINEKNPCGATYDKNSVVAIEIPDGYQVIDGGCAQDCTSYMAGLRDSTSLKFVDMTTCSTLKKLDDTSHHEAFGNCSALEYVKLADSVTQIGGWAFDECASLKRVVISENSQLTTMKAKSFYACTSLEAFYLPKTLTTITGNNTSNEATFAKCTSLYFVAEPDQLTKPEVYYFPESLTKVECEAFKNCTSINKVLVFGENVTKITSNWTFATNGDINPKRTADTAITIVFLGNMTNFAISNEMQYVSVVFANPNQGDIKFSVSSNNYTNAGAYMYKCVDGTCSALGATQRFTQEGFNHHVELENTGVKYNSYTEKGFVIDKCFCGTELVRSEATLDPLFAGIGYSIPEDERIGLAVSYSINKQGLARYKESISTDLEYGVFAVLESKIGTEDLFKEDGSLTTNSVCANLTNNEIKSVSLRIVGFTTDEQKALGLAMGIYIKETDNDKVKYSYVQINAPAENQKYSFISYNGVPQ